MTLYMISAKFVIGRAPRLARFQMSNGIYVERVVVPFVNRVLTEDAVDD